MSGRQSTGATTLGDKLKEVGRSTKDWIRELSVKPMRFALVETMGIAVFLGLLYFIDVHRGPESAKDRERKRHEADAKRNLRIRREVAGLGPAPHDTREVQTDSQPAAGFKVDDCRECADMCSNNPNCVSYECDPVHKFCKPTMKAMRAPEQKCSSVQVEFIESGRTAAVKSIDYDCKNASKKKDKHGKSKGVGIWGWPSRHPGATSAIIIGVLFYAICAWCLVAARASNPDLKAGFGSVLGRATVTIIGVAVAAVALVLVLVVLGAIVSLVASLATRGGAAGTAATSLQVLMDFSIAMGALAIAIVILSPLLEKHTRGPYARLMKNTVLYIPCLLADLARWLAKEWRIAPHAAWVLLGIEAVFILIRMLIPWLEEKIVNHDGIVLLEGPAYLDLPRGLGTFEQLHPPKKKGLPHFKYAFSLSAWFNLNPQPPNTRAAFTRFTPILDYGNKPRVSFNMETGELKVASEAGDGMVTIALVKGVAMQTWNNIVVNYDHGTMDVFLNGELVGSKPNISPFMQFENVTTGERKGLEGGICNVVYHPEPLSKSRILTGYKMLRDRRPPLP